MFEVGRAQHERLVALVRAAVDQVRRLGVGARDDDARHPHDVELEARGVEALDLFVRGTSTLPPWWPHFLVPGLLILDVVARHADLDEAADQVAHVRVAAVTGVGVGDDERPEVELLAVARCCSLICRRWYSWLRSAVSRARTSTAASSGTWLRG